MTTMTNEDPALPIEDLTPQAPSTIEVDDRDTFVKLLTRWHSLKVARVEQFLLLPEDADPPIEMQVGDGPTIKLQGDILVGIKAGVNLALMELGRLPFAVEYEQEADAGSAA